MKYSTIEKLYTDKSPENIFGVSKFKNVAVDMDCTARAASYDDDSIKDMTNTIETLIDNLSEYASDVEDIECSAEEWRTIAMDMWERLNPEDQEDYIMTHPLSNKAKANLRRLFDLEVLKKL